VINASHYSDTANLLCFYKSLIKPLLEFCSSAWSPYYEKDKQLIEKNQRLFTRMILDLKHVLYTIRYDTRCYFNVRSKADISQLNLPHGTDN